MEFKCVNINCNLVEVKVSFYNVTFKSKSNGDVYPDLVCPSCKQILQSISDGVSMSEKNIWAATEIGSPSKQWTKHGDKSIY